MANMALEKQIKRKFLPLLGNMGSAGALTFTIYYSIFPETVYYWLGFCFLIMLIGTVSGIMIVDYYEKKGKDIVKADVDRVRLLLQPAYIYTVIPFSILLALGLILSYGFTQAFFGFAFLPSIYFILGIGNGIFDYTQTANRKMLYTAIIPIAIALFSAFVSGPYGFYQDPVWIFGSLYLLFFLLIINRIKIEEMFILSKRVNVENKKSIRRRNDFLIMIFFVLYLIIFVVRNTFTKLSDWIIKSTFALINWIINQFYKLYTEIDTEQVTQVAEEVIEDGPPQMSPPLNPVAKTILIVIASLVITIVIYFLVKKIIQLVKWIIVKANDTFSGGARIKKDVDNEEFEEIVEFTKDRKQRSLLKRAPKYKYSISGLKFIDTYKEKVRYLYGFALERLKYKKVKVTRADTPEQIVEKLKSYENGDILVNSVFKDFTEEYINVRYGNKETATNDGFMDKADAVDNGIDKIKVKEKEDE